MTADGALEHISSLLQTAEMKAGLVDSLLQTVTSSASTAGFIMPTLEADNFRLWNQFCLNIGNGMSVLDAAILFRETSNRLPKFHPLPTPLTQATQTRIWFPIDIDGQPWIAHAQAIAQQPIHLIRQKNLQGEYASEAHLWMLTKTTDVHVPHYRCSLTSPCCSRLHFNCPMHSMCKVWGPNDCVHMRAGVQGCEDPHCKMVVWAKYSLCDMQESVPPYPDRAIVKKHGVDPLVYHAFKASDESLRERVQMVKTMA